MKSIAIKDLSENFFEVIGKEWMLRQAVKNISTP